jgi:hypothetical protein
VTKWGGSDVLSPEMRRVLAVGTALVSTALLAGGCGSSRHATSLPGLTATKLARLKAIVREAAKADGDARPSSVMVYATRRHEANVAGGAGTGVPGSQPVYLVIARGHFICSDCSRPAGAAAPSGNVIMMVLDRRTLRGLDGGIGGHLNTSKVGPGLPVQLNQA